MCNYFYCYSYRLMYYIKANGVNYINYGFNKNNHLKFYLFERTKELNEILTEWSKLKEKKKNEL